MIPPDRNDSNPIRVVLVDDSAVVRGLISRGLKHNPDINIVATASDGDMAISVLKRNPVDIVLLDIEMPHRDGLDALPDILAAAPHSHVIMVSSLTQRNAKISLQALELGAADYIPKPSSGDKDALERFYTELNTKVATLGAEARKHIQGSQPERHETAESQFPPESDTQTIPSPAALPDLRDIQAIAIAASTGGPQALIKLLKFAPESLHQVPVFITQHMPATFTALLADQIRNDTHLNCFEALDGEKVEKDRVYIAPGDYHMHIIRRSDGEYISLNQDAPVNFCRPAADPMFESLATCYGRHLLAFVLTGMGNDGRHGARQIKAAGGKLVVQDKDSSVVWGMPGAIVAEGFQDAIATLEEMADYLAQALR